MSTPKSGPFNKAVDSAVSCHVAEQVKKNCPDCLGTKTVYVPNGDGTHIRKACQRCEVTGLRGTSDD